jgi:hypothetical protein
VSEASTPGELNTVLLRVLRQRRNEGVTHSPGSFPRLKETRGQSPFSVDSRSLDSPRWCRPTFESPDKEKKKAR